MARLLRFLFGCALGATVAVLVTPKSGREVRRQLLSAARPVLLTRGPDEYAEPEDEQPWTWRAEPATEEPAAAAAVEEEAATDWFPASDAADVVLAPEEPAWEWSPTEPPPSEPQAVAETPPAEDWLVVEEAAVSEEAPASEETPASDVAPAPAADETSMPADLGDLRRRIAAAREALGSAVAQPARKEPTGEWFGAPETIAAEPAVEPPAPEEPVAEEPVAEEPAAEEPDAEELVVEEAAPEQPVVEEPAVEGFMASEVVEVELEAEPPAPEEPLVEEPAVEERGPEESSAEEPAAEEPVLEEPAGQWFAASEETMLEEPPLEMFLVKEPTGEEPPPMPVAEEPPAEPRAPYEPPVAEQRLVVEEVPPAEGSPADEAVAEAAPSSDSTAAPAETAPPAREGAIDPAEMRRRIEETRARLNAKAFDAMMSGEAALLSRDSGEESVPREADVGVGDDVAQTIEEGLSEDDA
jgi:hypothetical protein